MAPRYLIIRKMVRKRRSRGDRNECWSTITPAVDFQGLTSFPCAFSHIPFSMTKTKRRRKLQKQAVREIKKFQEKGKHATKQLIAKSCFRRLAREIASGYKTDLRFREEALDGLQEAAETQIVRLLSNANKVAVAEGRMTLQAKDLQIAKSIMEDSEINIPARAVRFVADEDDEDGEDGEDGEDSENEDDEGYVVVNRA